MASFVKVAKTTDLGPGEAILVHANGKAVALFRVGDSYFAMANNCTHRGGPLSEGYLEGHKVTCPWHGAQFDVTTGEVLGPPAMVPVAHYEVKVEGTDIKVAVGD